MEKLFISNSGSRMHALFNKPVSVDWNVHDKRDERRKLEAQAHKDLLQGNINPKLIEPIVHTADVSEGDTIVFPVANRKGPVWHRFDTASNRRQATATLVKPAIDRNQP